MTRPERILLLHDYGGGRGGAELLALDFRRLFRERGIDTLLLTSDADPWRDDQAPDVTVTGSIGPLRGVRETWNPSAAGELRRVLASFRPDIVQIVMFLTQLSPAILCELKTVPTVYAVNTYRAVCPTGLRWRSDTGLCTQAVGVGCADRNCLTRLGLPLRLAQYGLLHRLSGALDRIVAPSHATARILAHHGLPASDVVPHAVPAHTRRKPQQARPMLAYSGRLVPEKGVDWLIRAFALAARDRPEWELVIVGDGPDAARLKGLVADHGVTERVRFTGHLTREASNDVLESAWVQAVPSLWAEPFGLVAAEALARGTAVIASDIGGPGEIVSHDQTGWVVETGNDRALAEAITEALSDRAKTQRLGDAGPPVATARFNEADWIEGYLSIYGELLEAHQPEMAV